MALAACSSAASSSTGSTAGSSRSTTTLTDGSRPICSLVGPVAIKAATSLEVGSAHPTVHGSATTCTYKASDPSRSVIIEYDTAATSSSFAAAKSRVESQYGPTASLPGLGDQAYYSIVVDNQQTVTTVAVLQGSLQTIVIAAAPPIKVEQLAGQILAMLATPSGSGSTTTSTAAGGSATSTTRPPG